MYFQREKGDPPSIIREILLEKNLSYFAEVYFLIAQYGLCRLHGK